MLEDSILWASIEQALGSLPMPGAEEWEISAEIPHILYENCQSGRAQRYMRNHCACLPTDYVRLVLGWYRTEHPYVYRLRVEQDSPTWEGLINILFQATRRYLLRKGLPMWVVNDNVEDYVYEAMPALLHTHFPYHSSFRAWSVVAVQNTVDKCARWSMADKRARYRRVYLDDISPKAFLTMFAPGVESQVMHNYDLRQAVAQLPRRDQLLIYYHYVLGLSLDEAAPKLGISKSAAYALHKRLKPKLERLLGNSDMVPTRR